MICASVTPLVRSAALVPAHGLGGRTDLPVDPALAAAGAAAAVAVSFIVLVKGWPRSRFADPNAGLPLPQAITRVLDARLFVQAVRAVAAAVTVFIVAVAFQGPVETVNNLAPWALYVVFWVGLVPVSLLFGPVWRLLNPLRLLHAGLCRILKIDPEAGMRPLGPGVGMWPAAGVLLAFVWLELVYPHEAVPVLVGVLMVSYAGLTLVLALIFGRKWFSAGDGFEVYSALIGSMAPFGRRQDGTPVLRNPLTGLSAVPATAGLSAVVAVLIGSTGFDGLSRTQLWMANVPPDSIALGTAALLGLVAIVAILLAGAIQLSRRSMERAGSGRSPVQALRPARFAHSLIPVALGYVVAHYFSFLLFEGQIALVLISDPFGLGWDLFGTSEQWVNYFLVSPTAIGWTQISAIVIGHILGLTVAHDRALTLFHSRDAVRTQIPIAVLMVGITLTGVLLLLTA